MDRTSGSRRERPPSSTSFWLTFPEGPEIRFPPLGEGGGMQTDVVSARVERARELTESLTRQGIRAVALTNVDNSGITLVKTVPVSVLERATQFGIGLSPIFDVHLVNDLFTTSAELGGPVGDLRLMPDTLMLRPLAAQPGWAWVPTDQYTQEGVPFPSCQRTFARRMADRLTDAGITMQLAF